MSDLISRQEVEKAIKEFNKKRVDRLPEPSNFAEWEAHNRSLENLLDENVEMLKAIQGIPTAYNVEKIVQELKEQREADTNSYKFYKDTENEKMQATYTGKVSAFKDAIEIVRNGGKVDICEKDASNSWIPVEKGLPNEEEMKRAYCRNHYGSEFIVMIAGANRPTTLYRTMDGFWVDDKRETYKVLAWQPLPEAYMGETNE